MASFNLSSMYEAGSADGGREECCSPQFEVAKRREVEEAPTVKRARRFRSLSRVYARTKVSICRW
jgi:hypothetical protein